MRSHIATTDKEKSIPDNVPLISTTDLKGRITLVNDAFIEVSGFTREELIGKAHSIVRHPDVPPAVFADLWQVLHRGKPWMGTVKNRCKNGDYYWVNAFVTPIFEGHKVVGYQSVREKPKPNQIRRAEQIYARVNKGVNRFSLYDLKLRHIMPVIAAVSAMTPSVITGIWSLSYAGLIATSVSSALLMTGLSYFFLRPLNNATQRSEKYVKSDLLSEMYGNCTAEAGQLYLAGIMREANIRAMTTRITYSVNELYKLGDDTTQIAQHAADAINRQAAEIEQIAAVTHQLSGSIDNIAQNAADSCNATHRANQLAHQGKRAVQETSQAIFSLVDTIEQASDKVSRLHQATGEIADTISIITEIADQTNLLALNAAIEAARAGEQGRGFAVVADEVRALAQRTQESTGQIYRTLDNLTRETDDAVSIMRVSRQNAQSCVQQAEVAGETLATISETMESITGMSQATATAASQQSSAAEVIRNNLHQVNSAAVEATEASEQTKNASKNLIDNVRMIMQSIAR
ncbi:methyl-accepting chemotaxis protein [Oceanospirillum sediminis]|uniref:Methyl-accepting chemotaxis protein n=1 Tax=Oceanospirillum sediminis TaxID=2760088 RepID=A0A839IML9_9GAMM|nr:PAS domain-containing methyl-accepting chemotaxis protein [Oceanospirillum sediminis]MBB1486465.1 methyl-accepting chemotaxis protein [Oceanospirillum sediminis]